MSVEACRILYIEPSAETESPVFDELTQVMSAALKAGEPGRRFRGHHQCACGACSANYDVRLPGGCLTNTLAVHYLRDHRSAISAEELARVRVCLGLESGSEEGL